jgi:hypothetical protein
MMAAAGGTFAASNTEAIGTVSCAGTLAVYRAGTFCVDNVTAEFQAAEHQGPVGCHVSTTVALSLGSSTVLGASSGGIVSPEAESRYDATLLVLSLDKPPATDREHWAQRRRIKAFCDDRAYQAFLDFHADRRVNRKAAQALMDLINRHAGPEGDRAVAERLAGVFLQGFHGPEVDALREQCRQIVQDAAVHQPPTADTADPVPNGSSIHDSAPDDQEADRISRP